jgi:arylsulfatase A-like enzyme
VKGGNVNRSRRIPAQQTRREFFRSTATGLAPLAMAGDLAAQIGSAGRRPNILWLVSEDNNPYIGAYGDPVARTPAIDRLAREGILYENCFSQAPVCAPSRFTIITGMYATSCAPANHMRALGKGPRGLRGFPAYLRQAGYYCTNNAKTDYNTEIDLKDAWDESSGQAHWRKRPAGRPFFAVFNHNITHESQVFPEAQARHAPVALPVDPARVRIPAYVPDTPETRRDRANYYDLMSRLDTQLAAKLKDLEDAGLAEDTIVFYYGDNGGVLPRSKRFTYDSGLHVPLIVRFPDKWKHLAPAAPGSRIAAPVTFVDFAPTVLSLAGVEPPSHLQGKAFAGARNAGPQEYAFSFRDRMDERYDMCRTARDARYRYIRNYHPHRIWGQHVQYLWQQTGMAVWERLYREGRLNAAQSIFWQQKPEEELFDLATDPDEVNSLARDPAHQARLQRMRKALEQHLLEIRDNGFIPEGSPLEGYESTRDESAYPLERILAVANTATRRDPDQMPKLFE